VSIRPRRMCGIQPMNKTLALESIDLNLLVVFDAIL
jgi:hypothetical protein